MEADPVIHNAVFKDRKKNQNFESCKKIVAQLKFVSRFLDYCCLYLLSLF